MKILIFLLLPVFSLAQPKKATKIIVKNSDTAVIEKIKTAFYENGYTVESQDKQFISSSEKSLGNGSLKIRALVKDSAIVFTSVYAINVTLELWGVKTERTFDPLYFGGMKGSPLRELWNEFHKIAVLFGTEITYEK